MTNPSGIGARVLVSEQLLDQHTRANPDQSSQQYTAVVEISQVSYLQGLAAAFEMLGDEIGRYIPARARHADSRILDRTFAHRLDDHILLLDHVQRNVELARELGVVGRRRLFVDIGPGLGNKDDNLAQTSAEIALAFPTMSVVSIDRPRAVNLFKASVGSPGYERLRALPNLAVHEWSDAERLRTVLTEKADVRNGDRPYGFNSNTFTIFRAANSIDIYEDAVVNTQVLTETATDMAPNPVMFLFNRAILFKPADGLKWHFIGQVSFRGFNHNNQRIVGYGPGTPPAAEIFSPWYR